MIQGMSMSSASNLYSQSTTMLAVFLVSLFAISFPSLSKRVSFLSIPRVVFFVGKHFGTGVILSTAFVHLLQDAFESLNHPDVKKMSHVGEWTGLIVLGSLLVIFLVEYVSFAYVSRIDPEESFHDHGHSHSLDFEAVPPSNAPTTNERSPLLSSVHTSTYPRRHLPLDERGNEIFEGSHRFSRSSQAFSHQMSRSLSHVFFHAEVVRGKPSESNDSPNEEVDVAAVSETDQQRELNERIDEEQLNSNRVSVSDERQIVGILVLQFGIMIHSLVIGMTLSITSGADYASLVTAIIFHQLFEGLSLGTRIAILPHSSKKLQSTLAFLFAITVPIGITIGLLTFRGGLDSVKMRLIQGIMAAISSGMLIYAACVEMLAGDFIMDPTLWKSGVGKQLLAVVSLICGAAAMSVVGLWDKES